MEIINATTSNDYTTATTIENVWNSNGGYFSIQDAGVTVSLQYGQLGQLYWTLDAPVPTGNGVIFPGTTGIKFKSQVANTPATIQASLSFEGEPTVAIGAGGVATPATSGMIEGYVSSAGVILQGSGFTVTVLGTGLYQINFSTPFGAPPVVTPTFVRMSGPALIADLDGAPTTTTALIELIDPVAVARVNGFFQFVAVPVT